MIYHYANYLKLALSTFCLCLGIGCAECCAQTSVADNLRTSLVSEARVTAPPDDMFIDLQVMDHQIYVGETLKVEYDVYVASSRGEVFYDVEEPDFAQWYGIEGSVPKSSLSSYGRNYNKEPFATYFVSATKTGMIPLPALKVQVPYLQNKPWITHELRYIEVLPLPEPAPAGFYYGSVGNFQFESEISSMHVRVGELINMTIIVTANCPLSGIMLPSYELKQNSDAFKIYPVLNDLISEKADKDSVVSKRRFRYRLLALKAGTWTLDPIEFVSFDPKKHQYKTQVVGGYTVTVDPSNQLEAAAQSAPKLLKLDNQEISRIVLNKRFNQNISFGWMVLPILCFAGVCIGCFLHSRRQRFRDEIEKHKRCQQLSMNLANAETSDVQLQCVRELLELRFHVKLSGNEKEDIILLRQIFLAEDAVLIVKLINELRMTSYSTREPVHDEKMAKVETLLRRKKTMEQK